MATADVIRFGAVLSPGVEWEPFLESRLSRASGGNGTVQFPGPNVGFFWHVERIAIRGDSDTPVSFYISQVNDMLLVEYSYMVPNVADEAAPIYVPEGQPLIAVFEGAPNEALCIVHIQGRRYEAKGRDEWDSKAQLDPAAP